MSGELLGTCAPTRNDISIGCNSLVLRRLLGGEPPNWDVGISILGHVMNVIAVRDLTEALIAVGINHFSEERAEENQEYHPGNPLPPRFRGGRCIGGAGIGHSNY